VPLAASAASFASLNARNLLVFVALAARSVSVIDLEVESLFSADANASSALSLARSPAVFGINTPYALIESRER
jgi:hypothetical protein